MELNGKMTLALEEAGLDISSFSKEQLELMQSLSDFEMQKDYKDTIKFYKDNIKMVEEHDRIHAKKVFNNEQCTPQEEFLGSYNITDTYSFKMGEKYFDEIEQNTGTRMMKEAGLVKSALTAEQMSNTFEDVNLDIDQTQELMGFFDKINRRVAPLVRKYKNEMTERELLNGDDLSGLFAHAVVTKNKELYDSCYKIAEQTKIDYDKLSMKANFDNRTLLNLAPSRSDAFPGKFKEDYVFSNTFRQASFIKKCKEATGLDLMDIRLDSRSLLTSENIQKSYTYCADKLINLDKYKTPQEKFDALTDSTTMMIAANEALNTSTVVFGSSYRTLLYAQERSANSALSDENILKGFLDPISMQYAPKYTSQPSQKIESMLSCKNPFESAAKAVGIEEAPLPTAKELAQNAKLMRILITNSKTLDNREKANCLKAVDASLVSVKAKISDKAKEDKIKTASIKADAKKEVNERVQSEKERAKDYSDRKKILDKGYKEVMNDLKKNDRPEYDRRVAVEKLEAKENKAILKSSKEVTKAINNLKQYEMLKQAGLLTDKDKATYDKLTAKKLEVNEKFGKICEEAIKNNETRMANGQVNAEHKSGRLSQINSEDFSYHVMDSKIQQARQPAQGDCVRFGITAKDAQTMSLKDLMVKSGMVETSKNLPKDDPRASLTVEERKEEVDVLMRKQGLSKEEIEKQGIVIPEQKEARVKVALSDLTEKGEVKIDKPTTKSPGPQQEEIKAEVVKGV